MVVRSFLGRAAIMLAVAVYAAPTLAQSVAPAGYSDTLRWYHRQAAAGDARAQFLLGIKYETGTDVERDLARAAELYERAARQGLADAQFKYATMLQTGRGHAHDITGAETWYRAAALRDHAPAQFNLGVMLINKAQSDDDSAEGLSWLIRSSRTGLAPARALVEKLTDIHSEDIVRSARTLAELPLADVSNER